MDKQKAFEAAVLKEAEVSGQSGMQAAATDLRVSPCVLDNGDVIYINPVVQACWWAYRQGLKVQAAAAEALRPAFEKAVIERLKEGGFLEVEIRVECLPRDGEGYYDGSVNAYWHFYKQSRADLVIELPQRFDMQAGDGPGVYPQAEPGGEWVKADAMQAAIEAAGIQVAQ